MPCYKPLDAYHGPGGITFAHNKSFGIPVQVPCRRCIGCRLEKAREWALRCWHESSYLEEQGLKSTFITLTYAPQHLPADCGLHHEHFQKFIRKLRKKTGQKIRYLMSGEYGQPTEKNNFIARPHFHAILFGYRPTDMKLVKYNPDTGQKDFISPFIATVWSRGSHELGYVTFKNAGYVARYVLKKAKEDHDRDLMIPDPYGVINDENKRRPPYLKASLKPGIGADWFQKYKSDLYPHDHAVLPNGRQAPVPTYYRTLLERDDPALAELLRKRRVEKARNNPDNTPDRLAVRHEIRRKKAAKLVRSL